MKLSDDEAPIADHSKRDKKDKKKKKRSHQEMALEDLDEDKINAELEKYGVNPDDLKIDDELP